MSMISPDDMESSIARHGYRQEEHVHFQTVALGQSCKRTPILKQNTDLNFTIPFNDYA